MKKYRIFISTGEVSGDLQGALLVEALLRQARSLNLELEILALGGDRMEAAGATLLGRTTEIGSVGIFEGIPFVAATLKVQRKAKDYLQDNPPDILVMIDYGDPNISIGLHARKHLPQVPTVFFIAPQEWVVAINQQKTRWLVSISDRILSIFPEEARYYTEKGATVTFVGHPLVDRMQTAPTRESARLKLGIGEETAIAIIPGSRQQEIKYMMPILFEAARRIQAKIGNVKFLIPLSLEKYRTAITEAIDQYQINAMICETSLDAIAASDVALTKSGTVNLEIALSDVPQVVMYRVSAATAWIAKNILKLKIPFMSPPNLVLMDAIVPEFLQDAATSENIANAALELLKPEVREETIAGYQKMRQALGGIGACDRAAQEILQLLTL
jgi:lipid-A-disaccharide synthase